MPARPIHVLRGDAIRARSLARSGATALAILALGGAAEAGGDGDREVLRPVRGGGREWALPLGPAAMQGTEPARYVHPRQADRVQEEPPLPPPAGWHRRLVELAVSDESVRLGYRRLSGREDGYWEASGLVNEDDDVALVGRLVRQGQVVGRPVRLGVGISAYAAFLDETDEDVYALGLTGLAELDVPNAVPTTVAATLTVAPDITTFDDGEDLLDLELQARFELSAAAAAFVGFRALQVDTEADEVELDESVHVGVRLGL